MKLSPAAAAAGEELTLEDMIHWAGLSWVTGWESWSQYDTTSLISTNITLSYHSETAETLLNILTRGWDSAHVWPVHPPSTPASREIYFCQTKKLGVPQPTLPPPPAHLLETLSILNAVPCIWSIERWCKCVYLTVSWSLIKKVSNVMFLNLNWKWKYASGLITFQLMNRFLQLNQSSSDLWFYPRPGRICWTQF